MAFNFIVKQNYLFYERMFIKKVYMCRGLLGKSGI